MWDNPRLLNAAASLLFAIAAFILLCIVVLGAVNSSLFPLRTLAIEGEVQHIDEQIVGEAIAGRVTGNFFAVNLDELRGALEQMPWVRRAHVRRQWPDRLQVQIEEQVAVAQWGEKGGEKAGDQLVNRYGELFNGKVTQELPRFVGPLGSETEVTRHYVAFSQTLSPIEASITQIALSERSAWQLKLAMKDQPILTVMLGRGESEQSLGQRLARFVQYYPRMQAQLNRRVQYIDLRYPNGFAVRVPEVEQKSGNV